MGLDMYLTARLHTSEYNNKPAYEKLAKLKLPGVYIPPQYIENFGSFHIEVPLMYWRKVNAIHSWFVRECQEGVDDCRDAYVDVDKIRELDKTVSEVFMARTAEAALEKLPPTDGFFFGRTNIDQYFWEGLRVTMDATHRLLSDIDAGKLNGWDFYYTSSW